MKTTKNIVISTFEPPVNNVGVKIKPYICSELVR